MQNSDIFTKVGNSDRARFGIKRIQSFLTYNGAMGMCCGMNFVLLLYIRMYYKDYIVQYKQILPFLLFALAACIVFTGARSVMLAFAVGLLAFARPSIFKYKWTYFLIFIFILALPVLISFLAPIITSFVDTEAVGGSNVDMRTMQLDTAVYFWHKSFWTGNGIGFTNYVIENYREDIYGAESLWFSKMMNQGLLGMVAFSITIVQPIYVLIKNKLTPCIFIVLSFLVAKTMTSAPGITEAYHLIFVVVLLKVAQTYNDRKKVKNDKIQHNSTSI